MKTAKNHVKSLRRPPIRAMRVVPLIGALLFASSCNDDSTTAPAFTSITLTANAATVPQSGSAQITATMTELSGLPVADGTTITFTCCDGDAAADFSDASDSRLALQGAGNAALGTVEPSVASTVDGKVTVQFTAGARSGVARIVASSGGARAGRLNLPVGSAAATRVFLRATPPSVSPTGGSVQLTATVLDSASNGLPGVPVEFSTSAGTLSEPLVITDASGEATTRLTVQREAVVTASIGSAAQPASVTVRIIPAPTISASVSPQSPVAGSAAQFAFTAAPGTGGGAALRDLVINFGDGEQRTITGISGTTLVAHTFAAAGLYTVTGTVTDISGERATSTIVVAVQPRPTIIVSIEVQGTGTIFTNVPVVFAAIVSPSSELPRVASYEWDFGDGFTTQVNSHSVAHFFRNEGPHFVRVTVVMTDGARFIAQTAILVRQP